MAEETDVTKKLDEITDILTSEDRLKVLLDSNVLIAYLDDAHQFNYEARTIIDPLKEKECWFVLHYLVIGEFVNKWIELKKSSVKDAIDEFSAFHKSLKHCLTGGTPLTMNVILGNFKRHSKHKNFLKAHLNDFIILTEAETIKNLKIVTCDRYMCEAGKNIFKKNIYYLPFKTKRGNSELSRFIKDMEKIKF